MENLKIEYIDDFTILVNKQIVKASPLSTWRSIFFVDEYVIKLDINESEQCTNEIDLFEKIKGTDEEKYFVPILEYGESCGVHYIIQKRLRLRKSKVHTEELEDTLDHLQNKFGLWDLCDRNFTLQRGQVLIFDYGSYC
jgi:hypothetical protein